MKRLINVWAILLAFSVVGCQKDDGGGEGQHPTPLEAPVLVSPASGSTDVELSPTFVWETSGDGVVYDLLLSANQGRTWDLVANDLTVTTFSLVDVLALDNSTVYEWSVIASLNGKTEASDRFSFTTVDGEPEGPGDPEPYTDGQTILYIDSPKASPQHIIITGEGFIQEDYDNGLFDDVVEDMMDVFFTVEPYKAYKEYFEVHKLVSVSEESGISVDGFRPENPPARPTIPARGRQTKFDLRLPSGNGTGISITNKWGVIPVLGIYDYVREYFPDLGGDEVWENNVLIFIIVNENAWAGTNHPIPANGQSVTITALPKRINGTIDFGVALHESGHAVGKLADEYYSAGTITQEGINRVENVRGGDPWKLDPNVDFSGDRDAAVWAKYYDMPRYDDVDYFEGGHGYSGGVWRSTQQSLMRNDYTSLWFNTVSREAIVRRLKNIAGEPFDWDDFLENDVNRPAVPMASPLASPEIPLLEDHSPF